MNLSENNIIYLEQAVNTRTDLDDEDLNNFPEHIEILKERYGTRYVLWLVLINPQEKLYPVHWKWNEGTFDTKAAAEIAAKCKFPNLKIRYSES